MNTRLLAAKALAVGVVATALLSHHVYSEGSVTNLSLEVGGIALLTAAALGRIWSAAFITGKKSRVLVTEGPYSLTRNPLYFFSFLGFIGAGLAFESLTLAAALVAIFFLTHWPTILKEERKLRDLFGPVYDDYTRRVPRFFPSPHRPRLAESIDVSPRILTKAMLESAMVIGVFLVAHIEEWAQVNGHIPTLFTIY